MPGLCDADGVKKLGGGSPADGPVRVCIASEVCDVIYRQRSMHPEREQGG